MMRKNRIFLCYGLVLLFCVMMLVGMSILPISTIAETSSNDLTTPRDYNEIISSFNNANGRMMSIAHKGSWQEHPENSLSAVQAAIDEGVDIIEIDLRITKDGEVVLMHDGNVDRTTTGTGNVSDLTLSQIKQLKLRKSENSTIITEEEVPTFKEVLDICKNKVMLNLDKTKVANEGNVALVAWEIAQEYGLEDMLIFKSDENASTIVEWLKKAKSEHPQNKRPIYSMIYSISESDNIQTASDDFQNFLNLFESELGELPEMIELIGSVYNTNMLKEECLSLVKGKTRLMFNVMWHSISAQRDDNYLGWSDLYSYGINTFQTDYPKELSCFIQARYNQKNIGDRIEAEYFSEFSDISKINLIDKKALIVDENQTLIFENVKVSSDAKFINVIAGSTFANANIKIYQESVSEENLISTVKVGQVESFSSIELLGTSYAGVDIKHDGITKIFLQFDKKIAIDAFAFVSQESDVEEAYDTTVTTYVGIAPNLPVTVKGKYKNGMPALLQVKWDYIDTAKYSKTEEFSVKGVIVNTVIDVSAKVIVKENTAKLSSDGLLSAFKASDIKYKDKTNVLIWNNSVSGASNATLKTGEAIYEKNYINNYAPAVVFNGTGYLEFDLDINQKQQLTVISVSSSLTAISSESDNGKLPSGALMYFHETGSWGQFYLGSFTDYATLRFGVGTSNVRGFKYKRPTVKTSELTVTAGVKNSSSEKLFIDGEKVADEKSNSFIGSTTDTIKNIATTGYIGKGGNDGNALNFKGAITDILIYDRALSDQEIVDATDYYFLNYTQRINYVDSPEIVITQGQMPNLPELIDVEFYGGVYKSMPVIWDDNYDYSQVGTVIIYGSMDGYGLRVKAQIEIKEKDESLIIEPTEPNETSSGCGSVLKMESIFVFISVIVVLFFICSLYKKNIKKGGVKDEKK